MPGKRYILLHCIGHHLWHCQLALMFRSGGAQGCSGPAWRRALRVGAHWTACKDAIISHKHWDPGPPWHICLLGFSQKWCHWHHHSLGSPACSSHHGVNRPGQVAYGRDVIRAGPVDMISMKAICSPTENTINGDWKEGAAARKPRSKSSDSRPGTCKLDGWRESTKEYQGGCDDDQHHAKKRASWWATIARRCADSEAVAPSRRTHSVPRPAHHPGQVKRYIHSPKPSDFWSY